MSSKPGPQLQPNESDSFPKFVTEQVGKGQNYGDTIQIQPQVQQAYVWRIGILMTDLHQSHDAGDEKMLI
jgi:hypothetical protein